MPQPLAVPTRAALWRPGRQLFSSLRFRAKAALISLALFVPIVMLGTAYLLTVQTQIGFARQERQGVTAMGAFTPVLHGVLQARNSAQALQGGHDAAGALAAARQRTDVALDQFETQLQQLGDPLHLATRLKTLRSAWLASRQPAGGVDAQGRNVFGPVTDAAQALLRTITDESGLVLDPAVDSFFTVNGLVLVLPRLAEDIGQVWGWGTFGVARGGLESPAQYRQVAVWNARAGAGLQDLQATLDRAVQANASLASALDTRALAAVRRFQETGEPTDLIRAAATPEEVFRDGAQALATVMAVYDRALPALDGLLAARLTDLERGRNLKAGAVLTCLLLAAYLFTSFRLVLEDGFAELRRCLEALAAGDLRSAPQAQGRDETAELLRALAGTRQALLGLVGEVRDASHGIALASREIASGAGDLSGRAEQTATNLHEAAAAVEQISHTAGRTSARTAQATALARHNADAAAQGGKVVADVVQTMARIQDASRRIEDITGTIDAIAFQTNILALNAAVEAARAGAQGRGFAVVAGEVRTLAQRSASAAREIKALIHGNTTLTRHGATVAQRAGNTMNDLVGSADQIQQLLGEVSGDAQQQTDGVDHVARTVQALDGMTQHNTALAEESAAASEALHRRAQGLMRSVERFQLAAGDSADPR